MKKVLCILLAAMLSLLFLSCSEVADLSELEQFQSYVLSEDFYNDLADDGDYDQSTGDWSQESQRQSEESREQPQQPDDISEKSRVEYGAYYYDLESVVLYIDEYDCLPDNYITKREAQALGWNGGSVEPYFEGGAIGGDRFGNREGLLPKQSGRSYTECDIDTEGKSTRGAKRLVFSNDGYYYYTSDHYDSFDEVVITDEGEVIVE